MIASNCPDGSENSKMPILLPVLVRRSVRDTTVAATRPAVAPSFTDWQNAVQRWTFILSNSAW